MNPTSIKTGLLSYGMSGEVFHAPLLEAHSGFELSVIVERKSNKSKSRYPRVNIVKSVDEVMGDGSIELVIVNTPNETHHAFARQALEAGKHVIVEKPFTVTTQEADELISIARQHNRLLTVFQNRRWDGDFLTLKKIVDEKRVGKIAEFEAHYDRYRNYIESNTWKEAGGRGTGILYNLGSHMLDQVLVLFGAPGEVDARMGKQRPGGNVDDFYDIRLQYTDFLAIIKSSYLVKEPGPRYILHGINGSFIKYALDSQEQALKEGKIPGGENWGTEDKAFWGKLNTEKIEMIETIPGNYLGFYQNVYEAIREGKELAVKPEQAREGIRLIEACFESSKTHRAVKV